MQTFAPITLASVRTRLAAGESLASLVRDWHQRIEARGDDAVWIWRPSLEELLANLPQDPSFPLYGVPFAVKDNIDVAGWPTTAGCPEYAYTAERDAAVVRRLRAAGAIPMGKTNMDQFATGLVGTRSPYGIPHCVSDPDYISGGSSSGSAVAVAAGLCAFSLGTDTAGSGRVPAAFNGITGLKPSRGLISAAGVVPACRSIDCVSLFASTPAETAELLAIASGQDSEDAFSRSAPPSTLPWPSRLRLGVPAGEQLQFDGGDSYAVLYEQAVRRAVKLGAEIVTIDLAPFTRAAQFLYSGPWVAERSAAVGDFIATGPAGLDPVVASIIGNAGKWSARQAFEAQYRLEELRTVAAATWSEMDILFLPTTPAHYRIADVLADPITLNSRLGIWTNFVNLLDLCAIAVPAGTVPGTPRPFGVTFMAPARRDASLAAVAQQFVQGEPLSASLPPGTVLLSVAGAHLSGMPLHHQLTSRGARLVQTTRTAPGYKLFALPGTTPPKPGLVRTPGFSGQGIEVEVYALSAEDFGSFVAEIPPPMGICTVELADGSSVKGFLCEAHALEGALDISSYGGWRAWVNRGSQA